MQTGLIPPVVSSGRPIQRHIDLKIIGILNAVSVMQIGHSQETGDKITYEYYERHL